MFGKIKEEYPTLSYDGGRRREGEGRTSFWSLVLQVKNRAEDKGLFFSLIWHILFAIFTFYIYLSDT